MIYNFALAIIDGWIDENGIFKVQIANLVKDFKLN
jgi:hypothetical protein